MPTYEYRCKQDQSMLEMNRPVDERDTPLACPVCGENMTRQISAVPVKFNATGFYSTGG